MQWDSCESCGCVKATSSQNLLSTNENTRGLSYFESLQLPTTTSAFFGTILTLLFVVLVKVKKENYFSLNHTARALEIFVIPQKYSESMNDLFSVNMREA